MIKNAAYDQYGVEGNALKGGFRSAVPYGLGSEHFGRHPVVSSLFGRSGQLGAIAKNTGKSNFGKSVGQSATAGGVGGLGVGILAALMTKKPWLAPMFAAGGAGVGAAESMLPYGMGSAFGKRRDASSYTPPKR